MSEKQAGAEIPRLRMGGLGSECKTAKKEEEGESKLDATDRTV